MNMKKVVIAAVTLALGGSVLLNFPVGTFAETSTGVVSTNNDEVGSVWGSTLWNTPQGKDVFRIPAIATTNAGDLLAVTDLRYGHAADLGNHQIDLLTKISKDGGYTWGEETNLTEGLSTSTYGYGDAAIVADRSSDKVLILNAAGEKGFLASTRENPVRMTKIVSNNGGETFSKPKDITEHIYALDDSWGALFATSGRIMQSRYIKVGDYYRIYTAILEKTGEAQKKNHVLYSDDFGDTWHVLGATSASPVPGGDEAKIEEMPNGNVVITSRATNVRFVNMFTYDKEDATYSSGSWEPEALPASYGEGYGTNGEVLTVYAKNKQTNEYTHLILQSVPSTGSKTAQRKGVGIYYKEIDKNVDTVQEYVNGWSADKFYLVQPGMSSYSTMTIQEDGTVGFLYENRFWNDGYDIDYVNLNLETITNGQYENAYTGIGSEATPYIINTEEQLQAKERVFANEKVYWKVEGDVASNNDDVVGRDGRISVFFDKRPTEESVKKINNYRLGGQPLPEGTVISYVGNKKSVAIYLPENTLADYTGPVEFSTTNIVAKSDAKTSLDVLGTVDVNATASDLDGGLFYIDRNVENGRLIAVNYKKAVGNAVINLNNYTLNGEALPEGTTIRLQGNGTQVMIRLPITAMSTLGNNVEFVVKQSVVSGLSEDYTAILDFEEVVVNPFTN